MNNTSNRISAAFVVKGYIFFFICTSFVSCATFKLLIKECRNSVQIHINVKDFSWCIMTIKM